MLKIKKIIKPKIIQIMQGNERQKNTEVYQGLGKIHLIGSKTSSICEIKKRTVPISSKVLLIIVKSKLL
jgi:hypothetical protein